MRPPLQILLFRHPEDTDVVPYEEAIVRAFLGGKEEAGGYLASGEALDVQIDFFHSVPQDKESVADRLKLFCHTLTVVFIDRALLDKGGDALWDWLADCWKHTRASNGQHSMLAIPMDERIGSQLANKRSEFGTLQIRQLHEFGERAIRPAMLALRILHECRLLLARALPVATPGGEPQGFLRLFISHAKMDGLPLAHSLKNQISSIGWLKKFYDAEDLPAGCDWQLELEQGVGSSLIVILRTEAYDTRHWCQQEVLWADEYATPAVLVEARTALNHPAGFLPLDRVPSVRIPDGNLMRILFLALREGLRFLHFMRRVKEMKDTGALPASLELRVFSFAPGMAALLRACRSLEGVTGPRMILYPDPTLRTGLYEAAQALVDRYAPGTRLVTPETLAATPSPQP